MKVTIINCFDTYEHRVDLLVEYFIKRQDEVNVITSNFRHIEKTIRQDQKDKFSYIEAKPYYKNLSYDRLSSHWKLAKDIFLNLEQDIDLLWVLVPPNSFVKRAAEYKRKNPKVKLIFDIIDMWPETMPIGGLKTKFPINQWGKLRDDYLDEADYIVTECDLFQTRLPKKISKDKLSTIYLSREIKPSENQIVSNLPENAIGLCYLGSINNIIDLDMIGKILMSISRKNKVVFHIIGGGEKKEQLLSRANTAKVEVIDHGKVYDKELKQAIFNQCHFGLNIMKPSVFVGLTMKSLDYFEAGLPIINNIVGDTWEFVEKHGIGINTKNGDVNLNYYQASNRDNVRKFYETYFSYEEFTRRIDDILGKVSE